MKKIVCMMLITCNAQQLFSDDKVHSNISVQPVEALKRGHENIIKALDEQKKVIESIREKELLSGENGQRVALGMRKFDAWYENSIADIRKKLDELETALMNMRTVQTQAIFTFIYDRNVWQNAESRSGPGSTLIQTATIRAEIPHLLESFGIRTILDAPCGDLNWIKEVDLSFLDHYIGMDIVETIIARNRTRYTTATRSFVQGDLLVDQLPCVDLILCRDCLGHFNNDQIKQALRNFKKSGSKYLLTTTCTLITKNDVIHTGDWHPINLQCAPFNLPVPLVIIDEHYTDLRHGPLGKSLALWALDDIQVD